LPLSLTALLWHDADMKNKVLIAISALTLAPGCATTGSLATASAEPAAPQAEAPPPPAKLEYPSPPEIVAKAKAEEWVTIAPSDLLVMELAPLNGKARRVVIQLIAPPFSQGWVGNIRKLAAARWWDGTSINRVQDNYVVQWGDATEKKVLPQDLATVPESAYVSRIESRLIHDPIVHGYELYPDLSTFNTPGFAKDFQDGRGATFSHGWPVELKTADNQLTPLRIKETKSSSKRGKREIELEPVPLEPSFHTLVDANVWPIHCYGMVGVGRNLSPDTGTGAELYTVIGHAPRHLDRNIALVGRVIEGIEHLSSLPRGTGPLGFYEKEEERVPIQSVRIGNDIPDLPAFEYLSTDSESFAKYADARANRRDPFFNVPAGGADICNIPVPVRRKP
jgi:cyclophilin family peptidyl-prolyl cis-trans isomerase